MILLALFARFSLLTNASALLAYLPLPQERLVHHPGGEVVGNDHQLGAVPHSVLGVLDDLIVVMIWREQHSAAQHGTVHHNKARHGTPQ